jgi:hypothetical protein
MTTQPRLMTEATDPDVLSSEDGARILADARCLERTLQDVERPERTLRGIAVVPTAPMAPHPAGAGHCAPGTRQAGPTRSHP